MKQAGHSVFPDVLIVLFSAGIIVFCGMAVQADCRYRSGRATYEKLRQEAWGGKQAPADELKTEKINESNRAASRLQELPAIDEETLKGQNSEYLFWLYIPGTEINYPVVRHENNLYYLTHTFTGEENPCGSIFADSRAEEVSGSSAVTDTVIHGHNMRDGSMFGGLKRYGEQQYFNEHPDLWIYFGGRWFRGQIFSCRIAADEEREAYQASIAPEKRAAYVEAARAGSLYDTGVVPPGEGGRLVTLSTCHGSGGKLLVHAVFDEKE